MIEWKRSRLLLIVVILVFVFLSVVGISWAALTPVGELDLNQSGQAYEIFRDESGLLWISDYGAGEIWRVDPQNRLYTIFSHISGAADAKVDANGDLWWTDNKNNELGHLDVNQTTADMWTLTGEVSHTLGLALDAEGAVWTTDESVPSIHRFKPDIKEMCVFTVPDGGASTYIVADSNRLWIGDWINNRIVALDPTTPEFEVFHLPEGIDPNIYGLTVDPDHNIWWADQNQNFFGRLNPSSKSVTTYTVPLSLFGPTFISSDRDWLWSSGWSSGFIARLSPGKANGISATITSTVVATSPDCVLPVSSTDNDVTVDGPHEYTWVGDFYNRVYNFDGWLLYEIYPTDGSFGMPWGIVAAGQDIFVVDQGRQKLTQLKACFELKLSHSGDGLDPTSSSQTPGPCPQDEYLPGTLVTVTGHPANGSSIVKWLGTDPGQLPGLTNVVTMPADNRSVSVVYGLNTNIPLVLRN